jgi:hypothetical protein
MPTVTVNKRSANITVKAVNGILTPASSGSITLNNQGAVAGVPTRLDGLGDVVESSSANNATLVYNSQDDKYYVQELNLDGGDF